MGEAGHPLCTVPSPSVPSHPYCLPGPCRWWPVPSKAALKWRVSPVPAAGGCVARGHAQQGPRWRERARMKAPVVYHLLGSRRPGWGPRWSHLTPQDFPSQCSRWELEIDPLISNQVVYHKEIRNLEKYSLVGDGVRKTNVMGMC